MKKEKSKPVASPAAAELVLVRERKIADFDREGIADRFEASGVYHPHLPPAGCGRPTRT
jgi:hypothetical protein